MYIYIYIYIERERERHNIYGASFMDRPSAPPFARPRWSPKDEALASASLRSGGT